MKATRIIFVTQPLMEIHYGHQFYNIERHEFIKLVLKELYANYSNGNLNSFDLLVNMIVSSRSLNTDDQEALNHEDTFSKIFNRSGAKSSRVLNCINSALSSNGRNALKRLLFEAYQISQTPQTQEKACTSCFMVQKAVENVAEKLEELLSQQSDDIELLEIDFTMF